MNILNPILCLCISLVFKIQLNVAYLVNVQVISNTSSEKQTYCAIKKPGPKDNENNIIFDLFVLDIDYDPCEKTNLSGYFPTLYDSPLNTSTFFFQSSKGEFKNCSYTQSINSKILENKTRYAVIGSDGPINASADQNISMIFLPLIYSKRLHEFTNNQTSAIRIKIFKTNLYDYALIFLWFFAMICVILGAILARHEFVIMLYKKTKYVARNKHLELREAFYESQYFDPQTKNKPYKKDSTIAKINTKLSKLKNKNTGEISSQEHSGIYFKKPQESLNDAVDNDDFKIFASSTESIWKNSLNGFPGISSLTDEGRSSNQQASVKFEAKSHLFIFEEDDGDDIQQEHFKLDFNGKKITLIIFFGAVLCIIILLLLYFVYDVAIYIVYVFYFIAGTRSLTYLVMIPVRKYIFFSWRIKRNRIYGLRSRPYLIKLIIYGISLAFSILWIVFRQESYGWVFQLILDIAISISVLSQIRLKAFKYIAIILVIAFIYDVFMVFLSSYLTDGKSIMEAVVNGGKSYTKVASDWNKVQFELEFKKINRLPIILSIPNLHEFKKVCEPITGNQYTSLGLGDILIPGICINFSLVYDLSSSNRYKIYFFINILAYAIGLLLTFLGFILMNSSQPALLYICPLLVVFNVVISLFRKEFKEMWSGDTVHKYIDVNTGYVKNLKKYKVKKANTFNIIKMTNESASIDTVSGLSKILNSSTQSSINRVSNETRLNTTLSSQLS